MSRGVLPSLENPPLFLFVDSQNVVCRMTFPEISRKTRPAMACDLLGVLAVLQSPGNSDKTLTHFAFNILVILQ